MDGSPSSCPSGRAPSVGHRGGTHSGFASQRFRAAQQSLKFRTQTADVCWESFENVEYVIITYHIMLSIHDSYYY